MCVCSIVAIRDYHKVSELNSTNLLFLSSVGQKSNVSHPGLKSRCGQGCIDFRRLERKICVFVFSSF